MAKVYYKKVKEGDAIAASLPVGFITEWVNEACYSQEHIDAGLTEELEEADFNTALEASATLLAEWTAEQTAPPEE